MAQDRPTFHEAWYRVADLQPRLLSSVRVFRQQFRGQIWHVLENTANNQYSRLNANAYAFVGLLNGSRSVAQAWQIGNEQLGDDAPTQGEVIQILGQLYNSNLLYVSLSTDGEALFKRLQKRQSRQIRSYFTNLLFIRIPLLDPDWFLNSWLPLFGLFFSRLGLLAWFLLVGTGLGFIGSNFKELFAQARDVLAPGNLILLYLTFIVIKIGHEFSHAFACKTFGKLNKNGGQVHTMGVMFLVLFPLPYMDASSAWAFSSKWHRAVVGLAGIFFELAIAAIAAIVWANTSTGTTHIIAYNVIFVASISTLLFNGNPLLRFDSYYVLSDLIEIPNLSQRSKEYIHYLVKRYAWGVTQARQVATSLGERLWFFFYGLASTAYRIYISIRIALFLNDRLPEQFFFLVPFFIFSAVVGWVLMPLGKFAKYLFTGAELQRTRTRAIFCCSCIVVGLVYFLGIVEVADHCRVEGILEPEDLRMVYAQSDGFIDEFVDSGTRVTAAQILMHATNPDLEAQQRILAAERRRLLVQLWIAQTEETVATQILEEQLGALDEQVARVNTQLADLRLRAPIAGIWHAPELWRMKGLHVRRGQKIGQIGSPDALIMRATASQAIAALLKLDQQVYIRLKGYPQHLITGHFTLIAPMGQENLPSPALAYQVGGDVALRSDDTGRPKTAEKIFEIRIDLDVQAPETFRSGQRTVARIDLPPQPLLRQWYRLARQLFQRRFYI
ncbi:MAG: efflux RND transporter periplasmic adaptor subunit [Planctomycetes bacterium]|nr:efflux RND transporter periplasmic adaptor subunit [Planctomycetota bacterium]